MGKRLLKQEMRSSFEIMAVDARRHQFPDNQKNSTQAAIGSMVTSVPDVPSKAGVFCPKRSHQDSKALEAELAISQSRPLGHICFSRLADTSGISLIPVCVDPHPPL